MKFLERLDRIVRPIAIPNLTMVLVACQVLFWIASLGDPALRERAVLVWDKVIAGEVWRLLTFLLIAPTGSPIFAVFFFIILYMMGNFLERAWGNIRFNAFLYLGTVLTVAAAGVFHSQPTHGMFLEATIFLAFATLNPNFEFLLFFVLPVKVKYLAWLQTAFYTMTFLFGSWPTKLLVLASIGNYLIFFGPQLIGRAHGFQRRLNWQAKQAGNSREPTHVCTVCGVDSNVDPKMDFRYCSKCEGTHAYCENHLRDHAHVVENE